MDLNLQHKKVLVTGGSSGIGLAIAKQFLNEGAQVCIVARTQETLLQAEDTLTETGDGMVWSQVCDCTDINSLSELKKTVESNWGELDILIANIGDGRSVPDALPDNEQWQKTWNSNFESTLHTTRTFLPMLEQSNGCILFVSSITAMEAFGAPVDYSTAKTAVAALAKNMARKLAQKVRVNVIAPGNVYFEGGSWDEKIKQDAARVEKIIETTVPMNRFGTPEEVADAAVFLCSSRASFITGSILVIDGGQTVGVF